MNETLISIVIPVYNTCETLQRIVLTIEKVFNELHNYDYEIIFVDDNSPRKETWDKLVEITKNNDKITSIKLSKNFGQQSATICGFNYAKGERIVTMDDDLQHNPKHIPELLKYDNDIIIAKFKKKNHSFSKVATSKIKSYFDSIILKKPRHIEFSSFRVINKDIINKITNYNTPYPIIGAQFFSVTEDVINVEIEHHKRSSGKSGYNFIKRFNLFKNLLINNSSLLLNFIGKIGISISIFSFILASIILIRKIFFGINVVGWTSLMMVVLIIGGLLLFSVGIIGEYLLRILSTIENKPIYSISKIIKNK
ncbi:MAG: glycosyltransferase family 2 protein [Candidatus Cloacimonetes bacterium]|nr:glycosyltransferase family 2 protein [Candidatus Cloacimonadota bacterium]